MGPVEGLLRLAGKRSRREREWLVRAMADMYFATPSRSAQEARLFDEIMDMVLADVEPVARRELADRIAALEAPPPRTLRQLAGDEIDVAEPVLRHSPALSDDDLEPIARRDSEPHLIAIASRLSLSERLTDTLVSHGNDNVAGTLAGNAGARLSDQGFSILARHASANDNVLDLLVMRSDLPDRIATELLPVLASSIQARMANLDIELSAAATCDLLGATRAKLAQRLRSSATPARPLATLVELVASGELLLGEAIMELADADHLVDVAALMAHCLDLRSDIVVTHLFGEAVEPAMMLCRGAGLDPDGFSAILRLRTRRRRRACDPAAVLKDYLAIPYDAAIDVIAVVRAREARAPATVSIQ